MIKQTVTATLALALLAACQKADEPIAIDDGNNSAAADVETLPPSEEAGNAADVDNGVATNGPDKLPTIPAQYHGRWGMNANDCDPKKADVAKGLIEIDPLTLRFYEATATLAEQRPADATSYSGNFHFVGEGMKWDKLETLTVSGDTLKRTDKDGSFTYKRCA
jgi:hypothetical protein